MAKTQDLTLKDKVLINKANRKLGIEWTTNQYTGIQNTNSWLILTWNINPNTWTRKETLFNNPNISTDTSNIIKSTAEQVKQDIPESEFIIWTPTTNITPALTQAEKTAQTAKDYWLEIWDISTYWLVEEFKKRQQEDKTSFEKQLELQAKLREQQSKIESEKLMRAEAWAQSALVPWREWLIAQANIMAASWVTEWVKRAYEMQETQKQQYNLWIQQKQTELQRAQQDWKTSLAKSIQMEMDQLAVSKQNAENAKLKLQSDAEKEITSQVLWMLTWNETSEELYKTAQKFWINPNLLELQAKQKKTENLTEKAKQEFDNRNKAFDNLEKFASQWIEITPDFAKSLFQDTWVTDYGNITLMANSISKLKWEEKQLGIDKLNAEIEKIKADKDKKDTLAQTTEAKNFEYYAELNKKDPAMAQKFAEMAWIDTTQYQWWAPEVVAKTSQIQEWQTYNPSWVVDEFTWECARFVNDVLWTPKMFWSSLWDKTKHINSQVPAVWSVFISNQNRTDNEIWHVWIVEWIEKDENWNTILSIVQSNIKKWPDWRWIVTREKVTPKSAWIIWYYNPSSTTLTDVDISKFNDPKLDPNKLKSNQKTKYDQYITEKNKVMSNPDATVEEILKYSKWWKDLTDTPINQLSKYNNAISSMQEIKDLFDKQKTWPVLWALKWLNPYDVNAQALESAINAAIPNLARWVYWEVWVLTDNDINLYKKTLPNIRSTEWVANAVLALTLRKISNWYKWILQTQAWAWRDVSWFIWAYRSIENQIKSIEDKLPKEWEITPDMTDEEILQSLANKWSNITKDSSDDDILKYLINP